MATFLKPARMPRRSPNDLNLVPLPQYQRPEPPEDLEPAAAEVWRATVSSMRPDHFHPGMFPLLRCYCRAVVAGEMLAAERGRRTVDDPDFARLTRLCNEQGKATLALARSLRLTPKSRRDPIDARPEWRRRPWED
jgi:hypothetical protein